MEETVKKMIKHEERKPHGVTIHKVKPGNKRSQLTEREKSVITKGERREGATQGWGVRETKLLGAR